MILHRTPTHNYVSRPSGRTERVERFAHAMAYVVVIACAGLLTAAAVAGIAAGTIW